MIMTKMIAMPMMTMGMMMMMTIMRIMNLPRLMEREAFDWGGLEPWAWVAGIRWRKAVRQQRESKGEVDPGLLGATSRQSCDLQKKQYFIITA